MSNSESPAEKMVEKKIEEKKSPEVDLNRVPYPTRLLRQKYTQEHGHFLDMLKQLKINLPFVEALQHMPKYAKFLKDLLSNKQKLEGISTICLNEGCSAVVQNKLSEKLADPVHLKIPCLFGSSTESYALADLGASINLMPYSLYKRLDLGEPVPTHMSLSLADRSVKYPRGIVENVLVKVDKFCFPRGFWEENVTFNVVKSMRNSSSQDDSVYFLDTFISQFDRCLDYISGVDLLNHEDGVDVPPEHDLSILVGSSPKYPEVFTVADSTEGPKERPSIEAPTSLKLKELPPHLEYAFLDGDANLPVIISSQLTDDEKLRLVDVLMARKHAISWKLMDIQGIRPNFCTHRILMEDEYKPAIQPQRRLNPNMSEVVKKEVIKLLDACLIYPISDSSWVSPVLVVPMKGGMTVVTNKCNKLIPTRTVTATFQRCMVVIFHYMIESSMEVFMDNFSVYGDSFDQCRSNLEKMMKRCIETKLMLNWEKCHFMVTEGIVLGHKILRDGIEENYTTIEKELPTVVFAFDKFRSYLVLSKTIVYIDHEALRYLFAKKYAKPRLIRWILLLSEFDIEIRDKKGAENVAADHLSCLEDPKREENREHAIRDKFSHESLMMVTMRCDGLRENVSVELEHRAYWALRYVNLDLTQAAKNRYLQIHEVEELRDEAYTRSWSYKERTKALYDRKLRKVKEFKCRDRVLVYNSRPKLFPGKLRLRWVGPYTMKKVFPHGVVELVNHEGRAWKVNGHRLKHYIGVPVDSVEEDVFLLDIPTLTA
ncbi:uncharacterized protein LOC143567730 [Bidens hawaiensis]|uniref:uncharacterized protein LOC143567730 n=1 Tax=Bidens hawaiensis TaxID=980011 RepID=UPI00404B3D46